MDYEIDLPIQEKKLYLWKDKHICDCRDFLNCYTNDMNQFRIK